MTATPRHQTFERAIEDEATFLARCAVTAAKYALAPTQSRRAAVENYYAEVRTDDGDTDPYFVGVR